MAETNAKEGLWEHLHKLWDTVEGFDLSGGPEQKIGYGLPTYTLSVGSLTPTNLDGSTSESIIATNLPIKQSTPYYTIYCNLSSGEYISNRDKYQILGIYRSVSLQVTTCIQIPAPQ